MLCPLCGEENNRVINTEQATDRNAVVRVRKCLCCGYAFVTQESEFCPWRKKERVEKK